MNRCAVIGIVVTLLAGAAGCCVRTTCVTRCSAAATQPLVQLASRPHERSEDDWWALLMDLDDEDAAVRARSRSALIAAGDYSIPWLIRQVAGSSALSERAQLAAQVLVAIRPESRDLFAPFLAAEPGDMGGRSHPIAPGSTEGVWPGIFDLWHALRAWEIRSLDEWVMHLRQHTSATGISMEGRHASNALSAMGEQSLSRLVALLQDAEPHVRRWALITLLQNRDADDRVLMPIVDRVSDVEPRVRESAAAALQHLASRGQFSAAPEGHPVPGAAAGPVGDALVLLLFDPRTAYDGLYLLRLFPPAPSARLLKGLMALLQDEDESHWRGAAELLGELGPYAEPAIPLLDRVVLRSESWGTIDAAEAAIVRIRPR